MLYSENLGDVFVWLDAVLNEDHFGTIYVMVLCSIDTVRVCLLMGVANN
jgi:hypothetical protein